MGKTCCFFGHREVPEAIGEKLTAAVTSLIAEGFDTFYVGEEGAFDRLTQRVLSRVQAADPAVSCFVVHAYLPKEEPILPGLFPAEAEGGRLALRSSDGTAGCSPGLTRSSRTSDILPAAQQRWCTLRRGAGFPFSGFEKSS